MNDMLNSWSFDNIFVKPNVKCCSTTPGARILNRTWSFSIGCSVKLNPARRVVRSLKVHSIPNLKMSISCHSKPGPLLPPRQLLRSVPPAPAVGQLKIFWMGLPIESTSSEKAGLRKWESGFKKVECAKAGKWI